MPPALYLADGRLIQAGCHGALRIAFALAQHLEHCRKGLAERHYKSPKTKMYAAFAYRQTNEYIPRDGGQASMPAIYGK